MLRFAESRELRIVIGGNGRQQARRVVGGAGIFADAVLAAGCSIAP